MLVVVALVLNLVYAQVWEPALPETIKFVYQAHAKGVITTIPPSTTCHYDSVLNFWNPGYCGTRATYYTYMFVQPTSGTCLFKAHEFWSVYDYSAGTTYFWTLVSASQQCTGGTTGAWFCWILWQNERGTDNWLTECAQNIYNATLTPDDRFMVSLQETFDFQNGTLRHTNLTIARQDQTYPPMAIFKPPAQCTTPLFPTLRRVGRKQESVLGGPQ